MSKANIQLPTDDELETAYCKLISLVPGQPTIYIPRGQVTNGLIHAILTPGSINTVFVTEVGSSELKLYPFISTADKKN